MLNRLKMAGVNEIKEFFIFRLMIPHGVGCQVMTPAVIIHGAVTNNPGKSSAC